MEEEMKDQTIKSHSELIEYVNYLPEKEKELIIKNRENIFNQVYERLQLVLKSENTSTLYTHILPEIHMYTIYIYIYI